MRVAPNWGLAEDPYLIDVYIYMHLEHLHIQYSIHIYINISINIYIYIYICCPPQRPTFFRILALSAVFRAVFADFQISRCFLD